MKADSIRLACLFYEIGMIDSDAFAQFTTAGNSQPSKKLTDVLKQDVSAKSFRDLLSWTSSTLTMEIDIPFGKKGAEKEERPSEEIHKSTSLHSALSSQPLFLTPEQIRDLLNLWKPAPNDLLAALKDAGALSGVPEFTEKAKKSEDFYNRLTDSGALTVAAVNRAASCSRFKKLNRLFLALSMLKRNDILGQEDCDAILERYKEEGPGSIPQLNEEIRHFINALPEMPDAHIGGAEISKDLLELIPETFVRQNALLPLRKVEKEPFNYLEIAIADPFYVELTDLLALLIGRPVVGCYAPGNDLIGRVNDIYQSLKPAPAQYRRRADDAAQPTGDAAKFGRRASDRAAAAPVPPPRPPKAAPVLTIPPAKEAPSIKETTPVRAAAPLHESLPEKMADSYSAVELVSSIIENGIEHGATDIHLEPLENELRVRYRIDGRLRTVTRVPASQVLPVTSRLKVLSALDVTERRRPQDGHFSLRIGTAAFDFRVSTLPTRDGEKTVIRILDERRVLHNLESLGMPLKQADLIRKWVSRPHGLLLVTGPTGSGKTSTLYAAINSVNSEESNIVTIEDPVEYHLPGINQVQVDTTFNLGFAEGLRSILRQDPDIIMVGEIRDPETARIAIRSALTGHLVFSTLHTNTAAGAIATLTNMGIEAYMLVSAITGVISQRLIRCLCNDCKKAATPKKEDLAQLNIKSAARKKIWRAEGCASCLGSGYKGRTGIYEVMSMTPDLSAAIIAGKSEAELVQIMRAGGNVSLLDSAIEKMFEGITSPEEILDSLSLDE